MMLWPVYLYMLICIHTLFINVHIKLSVQDSKDLLIESLQKELQRLQKENSELKVENMKLKGGQVCKEFQNLSVYSVKANEGLLYKPGYNHTERIVCSILCKEVQFLSTAIENSTYDDKLITLVIIISNGNSLCSS